jgi:hypothetical protein
LASGWTATAAPSLLKGFVAQRELTTTPTESV